MKGDSRAIFTAAAHAQRAADFIHKFSAAADGRRVARIRLLSSCT